jgi:hypothetical protein
MKLGPYGPFPAHPAAASQVAPWGAPRIVGRSICKQNKVWKATGSEIARHYRAQSTGSALVEKKSARKK